MPHQQQQTQMSAGSPYQNGVGRISPDCFRSIADALAIQVAYTSPSQPVDYSQHTGMTNAQTQALSFALGEEDREQHNRTASSETYAQSPSASSPAYQQQQTYQNGPPSSRPQSGAPTPQQLDAAAAMMEQQTSRASQQTSSMPPPQTNGRPTVNRSMSQAANNGGTGSAAGTPQGTTPGATADYNSPGLQPPTPAASNNASPGAQPAAKRKRETKEFAREPKKVRFCYLQLFGGLS